MPYQPPSLNELIEAIDQLPALYTAQNSHRVKLISLITKLAHVNPNPDQAFLLSILVFGLQKVSAEYSFISAHQRHSWFFSMGSSLATILENKLKISPINSLTTEKKVIYLSALLQELTLNSDTLKQSVPDFNALVLDVHELLKQLLQLQKSDIETLLAKRPTAKALIRNFSNLSDNYNAVNPDKSRDNYVKFIKVIAEDCLAYSMDAANICLSADGERKPIGYTVRYGTLLIMMEDIENEYALRSPTNSAFYCLCQKALNIKHSSDIPIIEKLVYFSELFSFIPKFNLSRQGKLDWEDRGFTNAKVFLLELQKKLTSSISHMSQALTQPNSHQNEGYLESAGMYAAGLGISLVAHRVPMHVATNLTKNLVSNGAGLVGLALFSPVGGLIASQVGNIVEDKLIPYAVKKVIHNILGQLGNAIGKSAGHAVYLTVNIPLNVIHTLSDKFAKHDVSVEIPAYDDPEWINALLSLPTNLFDEKKKEILLNLIDAENLGVRDRQVPERSSAFCP